MYKIMISVIITGILYSCSNSSKVSYIQSTNEYEDIKFQVIHRPASDLVAQHLLHSPADRDRMEELYSQYGSHEHFLFVIQPVSEQQKQNFEENREFIYLQLQPFFRLVAGNDTIPGTFYHMEPKLFDGSYRATIAFEKPDNPAGRGMEILFDGYLFDKPILNFKL